MRQVLIYLRDSALAFVVMALALLLVLSSIFESLDVTFADIWQTLNISRPDEVQNYVLFTTLKYKTHEVITGTKYSSTRSSQIIQQWCYLNKTNTPNGAILRLDLANKDQSGRVHKTKINGSALAQFNLSVQEVEKLVTSHCRFK